MDVYLTLVKATALVLALAAVWPTRHWPWKERQLCCLLITVAALLWPLVWLAGLVQLVKWLWEANLPAPAPRETDGW